MELSILVVIHRVADSASWYTSATILWVLFESFEFIVSFKSVKNVKDAAHLVTSRLIVSA